MSEIVPPVTTPSVNAPRRKPKAPFPSHNASSSRRRLPPPVPPRLPHAARPTLPLKTAQGLRTRRTDSTHPEFGREAIFVTRSTGLGLLIGRCRSLVVDEGYTMLRLHAMGAAIPQALLLLHALLDILPYPKGEKGMWYEIHTGSVECIDEVSRPETVNVHGPQGSEEAISLDDLGRIEEDIGGMEEDETERKSRVKSSIQIDLHISARPRRREPGHPIQTGSGGKRRNRPSKKAREILAKRNRGEHLEGDEEAMINARAETGDHNGMRVVVDGVMDDEEEQEELEER